MKIDFNIELLALSGEPIMSKRPTKAQDKLAMRYRALEHLDEKTVDKIEELQDEVKETPLMFGEVCVNALMGAVKTKDQDGEMVLSRAMLATKILNTHDALADDQDDAGEYGLVKINKERATMLKELVKETYPDSVLVYARVCNILEGREQKDFGPVEDDDE